MVQYRQGTARNQVQFYSLDDLIAPDNMVRVIDAFVDILDFDTLGFAHIKTKETGTPPYHPALLLKIYLYGYLNRVRSSRKLEKECERNIEMQWLCERQVPSYHTIATFRTLKMEHPDKSGKEEDNINHRAALKEVFRAFNRFLNGEDLYGKETVATDGSKFRAQNAKKKNYTAEKLEKKIELADANIAQYLQDLDAFDASETETKEEQDLKAFTKQKLEETKKWKEKFEHYQTELQKRQALDPEVTQISLTDPEARSIVLNNSGHAEVSYNIVTAVDDKHKLIANFFTDNVNDTNLLAQSLIAVKAEFDNDFKADLHKTDQNADQNTEEGIDLKTKLNPSTILNGLADKGFHTASELQECADNGIITYVAVPKPAYSGKDKAFTIENFIYNETDDTFTCPNKQTLTSNGVWYDKKNRRGQFVTRYKRYNMSPKTCQECPFAQKCLSKTAIKYRISRQLERPESQKAVEDNKQRLANLEGKQRYLKRQAIVEHPFGTIKRQWASDYTLLRGMEKVNGEFAIVFTCYNIRRAISILGAQTLINRLKSLKMGGLAGFIRFICSLWGRTWESGTPSPFFYRAPVRRLNYF
jgi:transposase